jgi:cytidyltransferase-like protein
MTTIVIMPGGFHPFHAGHAALYQSARRAFPDAEVYVAATNDTSTRPFPFPVKEKLARLAGVEPGHFVQVTSPFQAKEITSQYNPEQDRLIFVRSEKDATKPPQPGGVKKDGSPSYLQSLEAANKLEPFAKHAYMAYLPTVEFGPGMTSATEIRAAWPKLNERRKTALVMSLYPKTQGNEKLATNVVGLLDAAIGTQGVAEGSEKAEKYKAHLLKTAPRVMDFLAKTVKGWRPSEQEMLGAIDTAYTVMKHTSDVKQAGKAMMDELNTLHRMSQGKQGVAEGAPIVVAQAPIHIRNPKKTPQPYRNQGDIVPPTKPPSTEKRGVKGRPGQRPMPDYTKDVDENQGWAATYENAGQMAGTPAVGGMWAGYQQRENQPVDEDYIEEKWSAKYKSSINCANPQGFSQRAHCAGRKK